MKCFAKGPRHLLTHRPALGPRRQHPWDPGYLLSPKTNPKTRKSGTGAQDLSLVSRFPASRRTEKNKPRRQRKDLGKQKRGGWMDRGPAHPHSQVPTATTAPGTPSPTPPRPPPGPAARSFPPRGFGKDRRGRQPASPNRDNPACSPERAGARERQPRRGPQPSQSAPPATHHRPGHW